MASPIGVAEAERRERLSRTARHGAVAVTLAVAGPYAAHFGGRVRFPTDEADYLAISRNLVHGRGFTIDGHTATAFRAPGYPALLAAFRFVGVPVTGLRLVNVVLLAVAVVLAWHLAHRLGGPVAAAIAAGCVAVYPLDVYAASTFFPQTLAATLLLGAALVTLRADGLVTTDPRQARRWMAVAGLLSALLVLSVPDLGVCSVVLLAWFGCRHRRAGARALVTAVVLLLVPVGAWTVRNAVQVHGFVPVTTGSGVNLLLGNSEHTTPRSGVKVDISKYVESARSRHLDEVHADAYYRSAAVSYVERHPEQSLARWVAKSLNYFSPTSDLASTGQSSTGRDLLATLAYWPVLALVVVGLWRARRGLEPGARVIAVMYFAMAPVMGVFFTRVRFRIPLDGLLLVLAAVVLARWPARRQVGTAAGEVVPAPAPVSPS